MAAQLQVLRRRIRSVGSMKKITKAMELVATSRVGKAQARVAASLANAEADITHVEMADETPQESTDLRFVIAVQGAIGLLEKVDDGDGLGHIFLLIQPILEFFHTLEEFRILDTVSPARMNDHFDSL